ncbi:TonB-dependent receptor domain-containing protein [Christiangramia sp. ASW11-125]|uniref:TonB-dependent receptor domain-containing protein n=1 Tax=Christiangramia sp. ASW11-125 TaxID=3400701 RepID=UPI003AACE034
MKQLILCLFLSFISIASAKTDPNGNVSGTIMDAELREAIPYATIIINNTEGELVTGITSAEDGSFIVENLKAGTYELKVQFIGYKTFRRDIVIEQRRTNIEIGILYLEPDVAMLDETLVVAERTTIEQRVDRKVINIGKDLMTTGASASEIMVNIPSVNVDQDGNISLRGNSNVRILVDGKPTNMDPAQLLKQIPSTSIKSIELITNPSAKYNPEGMSGIINIVLHKNANNGFNGNLNSGLTYGENLRLNGSLDMNYRKGKFNFFGNLGSNFGDRENGGTIFLPESQSLQEFEVENRNNSYLYKIGVDFYVDDNNTFSIYTNQNLYDGGPIGALSFTDFDNPSRNFRQFLDVNYDNSNASYNFLYDHNFEKDGHEIQFEADFNDYNGDEVADIDFAENELQLIPYIDRVFEDRRNFISNIDYTNPLNDVSRLELGAEARLLKTENDYNTTNPQFTNADYIYDRDILSLYSTFGQNFEKWSYQVGARLESYQVTADFQGERVYEDDYLTVYPTGFLNFTPDEKNTYNLSYSRRVDRPGFSQINPIREVSSPRLIVAGNPELDPQFTNSFEFNYTRKIERKGSLSAGVFFRRTVDEINQIFTELDNEPGSLFLTFQNSGDADMYGLEFSSNYKFKKWWSTNSGFELYEQTFSGLVGTEFTEIDNTAFTFRTSHNFKATETLSFSAFGFYRSKMKSLQYDIDHMYFMNLGARYNFLDDNRATVSLNFNDVFDTQEFNILAGRPFDQVGRFKGETQTVYLGVSYRFGGGKNRSLQRKDRDKDNDGGGMF